METKTCPKCHETKSVTEFYKAKKSKDGLQHTCKTCARTYDKVYHTSPSSNKKYLDRLVPSDEAKFENGVITVICKSCGKRFMPHSSDVYNRSKAVAVDGCMSGEANFYCSDECKDSCPLYGFHSNSVNPKSKLYVESEKRQKARSCQNNILKQMQCDEKGYTYCEVCGDIIDVELHHTLPVAQFGDDAINPAGHMLVCAGCHVRIHAECK